MDRWLASAVDKLSLYLLQYRGLEEGLIDHAGIGGFKRRRMIMGKPDPKLLEMAKVFRIPKDAQLKYIILPARMPALSGMLNKKKRERKVRDNDN